MKKTGTKKKFLSFFIFLLLLSFPAGRYWAQEGEDACVEYTVVHDEDFFTIDYKNEDLSSVDHWGEGYITLNRIGANFPDPAASNVPSWINTLTGNDFDLDGRSDIIVSSSNYNNVLAFVHNTGTTDPQGKWVFEITYWIDGCAGQPGNDQWPELGIGGAEPDTDNKHVGMTSADYDGDGDFDFFFVVGRDGSPYTLLRVYLYRNNLIELGALSFTRVDMTASWGPQMKGIPMTSTFMDSMDFDSDGDVDILYGNGEGDIHLIRNKGTGTVDANAFMLEPIPILSTGLPGRGVSTVSVADFDLDGDLDIFTSGLDVPQLRLYRNNGSDVFFLDDVYRDPDGGINDNDYDGSASVSLCADFDDDGDPDIIIGTDYHTAPGGIIYFYRNMNGTFDPEDPEALQFFPKKIFDMRDDPTVDFYDFDCGSVMDYDGDGDKDFLIADGNHTETYYVMTNELADVFNLIGNAVSLNITPEALDPDQHAVTKIRINNLKEKKVGIGGGTGAVIDYYVSNDGGLNWEFYVSHEVTDFHTYNDMEWHSFNHYGSDVRWKAVLHASEDVMEDFTDASYDSPSVEQITFEFVYVDRREYSRTFVATTLIDDVNNVQKKLLIGGTFYFPGWEGHLRAYNISDMAAVSTGYSNLRTITRSDPSSPSGRTLDAAGVSIEWDAGELLDARTAAGRTIYTALPDTEGDLARLLFTTANLAVLGPVIQDVNGDNQGLINFVRGEGRDWKLGDINHSNPIVVGAPEENQDMMGPDYGVFKESWKDRDKVLYVGANDGMLHCFDVATGEEKWGFIPHNLLRRLRNMYVFDPVTQTRYFKRHVYVDGSPAVSDVFIDANDDGDKEWRTVLICGQGAGYGSTAGGSINCYFALDITDPDNPQPLWEFTDETMGETWSTPAIGKITRKDEGTTWTAFMGSGYDNNENEECGNVFYAVDIETGTAFFSFDAGEVNTQSKKGWNIVNSLPGAPGILDIGGEGFVDRVYIGDLDGRIWKVDTQEEFEIKGNKPNWSGDIIYTDSENYPILCKPAVWVNPVLGADVPHVYFGTGGDDLAPDDTTYSFISLMDGAKTEVEWFVGDDSLLNLDDEKDVGDLDVGEKVWADPVVGDFIVYFSTLTGSIENVDPCANLEGTGKLYARYIQSAAGSTVIGGTALTTAAGPMEYMDLISKSRSAVTLGDKERTSEGVRKREVFVQEYDSTIEKLEQPTGAILKIKSWREVYRIIKK
ncbi:MAG: VCBS repeat-containing protein [Candidatus Aminicenantes bacterium]|nr:VCBS repeat-containing protein [Candidatus Aminicenantes bacterium]